MSAKTVTVDLADLETIVLTTGALKTIEGAIVARKNDPFVRPHLEFTAAHNRLASAMRNATRAEAGTLVPWDGDLDQEEIDMLRRVAYRAGGFEKVTPFQFVQKTQLKPFEIVRMDRSYLSDQELTLHHKPIVDRLVAKGMIGVGKILTGLLWEDDPSPSMSARHDIYAVKITQRGYDRLERILGDSGKRPDE